MSPVPQFLKRLEARIALALAEARSALLGVASLSNSTTQVNAAAPPVAGTVQFSSTNFTTRTGKVLVMGQGFLVPGGGTMVSGDTVSGQLVRDGALIPAGTGYFSSVGATAPGAYADGGQFIDTVVPGSTHTWGIQALIAGGAHTGTFTTRAAVITIIELPG